MVTLWPAPTTTSGGLGFNLNIFQAMEQLGGEDYVEINREARPRILEPGSSLPLRSLGRPMRQMPPGLFNVRGYDRSVYKTSSVIYTVIPRRGPWNFRFICSFFSIFPRFPGSVWYLAWGFPTVPSRTPLLLSSRPCSVRKDSAQLLQTRDQEAAAPRLHCQQV